jgi:hypothetical protein
MEVGSSKIRKTVRLIIREDQDKISNNIIIIIMATIIAIATTATVNNNKADSNKILTD